jgi:hypothetical protein
MHLTQADEIYALKIRNSFFGLSLDAELPPIAMFCLNITICEGKGVTALVGDKFGGRGIEGRLRREVEGKIAARGGRLEKELDKLTTAENGVESFQQAFRVISFQGAFRFPKYLASNTQ